MNLWSCLWLKLYYLLFLLRRLPPHRSGQSSGWFGGVITKLTNQGSVFFRSWPPANCHVSHTTCWVYHKRSSPITRRSARLKNRSGLFLSTPQLQPKLKHGEKIYFKHCQRHKGLEDWVQLTKVTCLCRSYHKFKHKSWSHFIFRISTKHQLKISHQTLASPLNLKFKILTKSSFRISTKI